MAHPPSTPSTETIIAQGEDEAQLKDRLKGLIADSASEGLWSMSPDRMGLERQISFRTFKLCWEFMTLIASQCQKEKHHPEWTNVKPSPVVPVMLTISQVYRTVSIRWTTHVPRGLSMKDIRMAEYCDWAECVVQNSLKELERLRSRDEITAEEFEVLVELSSGMSGAEGISAGVVHTEEGSEGVKGVDIDGGGVVLGNAKGSSEEKMASTDNTEAFRQRIERLKRYYVPPKRLDNEGSLKP